MNPATTNEVTNNAIGIALCVVLSAVFICGYISITTRNLRKLIKEYNERYGQLARQAEGVSKRRWKRGEAGGRQHRKEDR